MSAFCDYFGCPEQFNLLRPPTALCGAPRFFRFGSAAAYGRVSTGSPGPDSLDLTDRAAGSGDAVVLPFSLDEVADNLRLERYPRVSGLTKSGTARLIRDAYYSIRPCLPTRIRKHLQRLYFSGWQSISFPTWPVDVSVDALMRRALQEVLTHTGISQVPFIWFWPDAARGCVAITHDVEGKAGREFCSELAALDASFGFRPAFQIVPVVNGQQVDALIGDLRVGGCEVNLHDLNHDCYLFDDRAEFLRRAAEINRYAREFACQGFRSAAMFREQSWFDAFEFRYDMSVPNVAHLEPQRGGCCTVMPYFIGDVVELPLTTTQDYTLFHILDDYSTALWRLQIETVLAQNGLVTLLTHPDYLREPRALEVYVALLEYLQELHAGGDVWFALPGDVDRWVRSRRQMSLVHDGNSWRITGPDHERAVVAYASLREGHLVFSLDRSIAEVA